MLTRRLAAQGSLLFRFRSYLPFALLIPCFVVGARFEYFASSHEAQHLWALGCLAISFAGLAVRIGVVGFAPRNTSGRNTDRQVAESLNTTGLYSVVRNPLYLGNYIIWLGVVMVFADSMLAMVYTLAFWLYYERIIAAEEEFLSSKFGDQYQDWCSRTPPFFPRLSKWVRPTHKFSLKRVLKREYWGLFGITTGFFLLDVAEHVWVDHRLYFDTIWTVIFFAGLILSMLLRVLRKHTSVLAEAL